MDVLTEPFFKKEYQLLPGIPECVEKEALVVDMLDDGTKGKFLHMDVVWSMYIQDKLTLFF